VLRTVTVFEPSSIVLAIADGVGSGAPAVSHMDSVMMHLVLQLAVILIAARLSGLFFQRYLKMPSVLGELIAGIIIGPYAFGQISIPGIGPLFPLGQGVIPVSGELYGFATVASILLLFLSGLETDLTLFIRYSVAGAAVGLGGVIFSFAFGALSAVWFGLADSFMDPSALFLGAISTATSVGITARILSEKRKTDSPEGVTILAGAVLDDVLGIIMLAIVVAMARIKGSGGHIDWGRILMISAKAIGFWLAFTFVGLFSARYVTRVLKSLRSMEIIVSISFGLALLVAGLMEMAGLAMIIGAYIMGLSLSRTDLAHAIQENLHGIYNLLVPVFFCVMGMLVDVVALKAVLVFGAVYTVIAILSKLIGCGIPAWFMKFNMLGSLRIGAGMVPRGEVALIIASIGLSAGAIRGDVFGAAVMMTLLTTLIAPPILSRSFDGRSGLKPGAAAREEPIKSIMLEFPSPDLAEFMLSRFAQGFRNEEFFVYRLGHDTDTYQIRKDDMVFSLTQEGEKIILTAPAKHEHVARFIALEELLVLQDLASSFEKMRDLDSMKSSLLSGIFDAGA